MSLEQYLAIPREVDRWSCVVLTIEEKRKKKEGGGGGGGIPSTLRIVLFQFKPFKSVSKWSTTNLPLKISC